MNNIVFMKPPVILLKVQGYTCVDMHVHTNYSQDAFSKIPKILKRAEKFGIGVAITDHNRVDGAVHIYEKRKDVFIIPGIEIKSFTGIDYLIYFYNIQDLVHFFDNQIRASVQKNPMVSRLRDEEIIQRTRHYKCVIAAPHPCIPRSLGLADVIKRKAVPMSILKDIPLIEGLNGRIPHTMNLKALEWASSCKKYMIAGSDAHLSKAVGRVLTCVQLEENEHFLDAIQKRQALLVGKECFRLTEASHYLRGQLKMITRKKGIRMFAENLHLSLSLKRRTKAKGKS